MRIICDPFFSPYEYVFLISFEVYYFFFFFFKPSQVYYLKLRVVITYYVNVR